MTTMNQAQAVTCDAIRNLMKPAAWPLPTDEVERRRREAEKLLGRPFPKLPREDINRYGVSDLTAIVEWCKLDTLRHGSAPHVRRLSDGKCYAETV